MYRVSALNMKGHDLTSSGPRGAWTLLGQFTSDAGQSKTVENTGRLLRKTGEAVSI